MQGASNGGGPSRVEVNRATTPVFTADLSETPLQQTASDLTSATFEVEPVLRPREQVETQLRRAITSGVFAHGDRLPNEGQLAENFKVSRSTIREALRGLVEVGLIRTVPGARGGSFVEYFNHHTLSELVFERLNNTLELGSVTYEEVAGFRNLLEVPSARLAALNRTEAHLLALRDVIDQEKVTTTDDPEVENYNARFHGILAEASGNRVLVAFVNALHRVTHPLRFIETSPEVGRQAVRHHIAIATAVDARDSERAAAAMEQHLDYLRQHAPHE